MNHSQLLEQNAFEKSYAKKCKLTDDLDDLFQKDENGDYLVVLVATMWEGWCSCREYMETLSIGSTLSVPVSQEPKYTTKQGVIVNRFSGEVIPPDEPIFIFRARDSLALGAICAYADMLPKGSDHHKAVVARVESFRDFSVKFPARMKQPDTPNMTAGAGSHAYSQSPVGYPLYATFRTRPDENGGKEFLHFAMWHRDTFLEHGERIVRGYFFVDSTLPVEQVP